MICQYGSCCNKAIKKVNYMNEKEPQYAWMCEECAKEFDEAPTKKENEGK